MIDARNYSEAEVRQLRDNIYGRTAEADKNWEACRDNWMRPDDIQWLLDHQPHKTEIVK